MQTITQLYRHNYTQQLAVSNSVSRHLHKSYRGHFRALFHLCLTENLKLPYTLLAAYLITSIKLLQSAGRNCLDSFILTC